jgi:hypothetical protein
MIGEAFMGYLAAEGYGTVGDDLFLGFQPDSPDNCITIYDTSPPVLPESQGLQVDNMTCQILVRNEDYLQASDTVQSIHKGIVGFSGTMGEFAVTMVFVDQAPASIGLDEKGRAEWSAHYRFRVISKGDTFRL